MATLSGGEAQRIRLASQLGSGLVGVTYVLDEPSIGLHPRDNTRLLATLKSLQARGNTVLVVEHDEATIRAADHLIELGPGSGALGGEMVFGGPVQKLLRDADTLTAKYLRREMTIETPTTRRAPKGWLTLKGVRTNNLRNLDCAFPLGSLICVTGVSGSGKSSLVVDSLYKHLALSQGDQGGRSRPHRRHGRRGAHRTGHLHRPDPHRPHPPLQSRHLHQSLRRDPEHLLHEPPTPGNAATNPAASASTCAAAVARHARGTAPSGWRCSSLPDVFVTCDICKGKRYNRETLEVRYKDANIDEVLHMTVRQARKFFENYPVLARRLSVLEEVGLEYLTLGQPATTLSGGEAQRIKISRELGKRSLPGALYVLDEPTTGLHMHEVGKLIRVLHGLVDKGATVVVIEHNTDVILAADHVIGPGAGRRRLRRSHHGPGRPGRDHRRREVGDRQVFEGKGIRRTPRGRALFHEKGFPPTLPPS